MPVVQQLAVDLEVDIFEEWPLAVPRLVVVGVLELDSSVSGRATGPVDEQRRFGADHHIATEFGCVRLFGKL